MHRHDARPCHFVNGILNRLMEHPLFTRVTGYILSGMPQ
jgi:hypothetical protein